MKREQIGKKLKRECDIFLYDTINSTNILAKEMAAQGAGEGTLIISERQTSGRGRLGRTFFSAFGGIYMSIILRPDSSPKETLFITAAAAVAVSRALERVSGKKCLIKWVNDVYIKGKKVCGILTESALCGDKTQYVVLGIGVNLTLKNQDFPEEIRNLADTVFGECEIGEEKKASVIAEIVNEFFDIYSKINERNFMEEYKSRSFLDGLTVCYEKDGINHIAKVIGINDDAALRLEENGQEILLSAGEVSVKPVEELL